jgi:antitoxin VapB
MHIAIHVTSNARQICPTKPNFFFTHNSQAVRLPLEYRFEGSEVFIRRDPVTGHVILSRRPSSWDDFFMMDSYVVPDDFLSKTDRQPQPDKPSPL